MKIIELQSENIKKIKAIQIIPKDDVLFIEGKNGAGKSSVLDSIAYCLGGADLIPEMPIRKGQKKASVKVVIDELVITRTWTEKGSYLEIKNNDGAKYPSPQAMLDKLIGNLSFDPLEFARMKNQQQVGILKEITGLNFDELDTEKKELYEERTLVNRELKSLQAQHDAMPAGKEGEHVEIQSLRNQRDAVVDARQQNEKDIICLKAMKEKLSAIFIFGLRLDEKYDNRLKELKEQYEKATENASKEYHADKDKLKKRIPEMQKDIETLQASIKQEDWQSKINTITKEILKAQEQNELIKLFVRKAEAQNALGRKSIAADNLTSSIEQIEHNKKEQLQNAKFPITGLSFSENAVLYNEIPFAQLSDSEKLKVSISIGLALNPKLKVMLIRDGSLLDKSNIELLNSIAKNNDAQLWIEKVADAKNAGIWIEDGEIK